MVMQTRSFEYAVRDRAGRLVNGRTQAPTQDAAVARLLRQGLVPVSVKEAGAGMNREISLGFTRRVGLRELAVMARQFATMIDSGLSLLRSLTILGEQTGNKTLAVALAQVRTAVEDGGSLSSALGRHPRVFPPMMVNMIRAGEVGGFLDRALLRVAEIFEAEVALRRKIKSAMTYPVAVFVVAVLAVTGMLLFIVPVFEGMFQSLGGTLPGPTRVLVFLSHSLTFLLPLLVVLGVAGGVAWVRVRHTERVRRAVDPVKLRVPVFGPLFRKVAISRFTRSLGTMMACGVPLLQALDVVGAASGNLVIADAARAVGSSVRAGRSLSAPLAAHAVFPPMVVQMLAVGEDTGALDAMLAKIADFYDQEVEATAETLTSLIEPIMISILGGLVGVMIIVLYLPVFSVFTLVN